MGQQRQRPFQWKATPRTKPQRVADLLLAASWTKHREEFFELCTLFLALTSLRFAPTGFLI